MTLEQSCGRNHDGRSGRRYPCMETAIQGPEVTAQGSGRGLCGWDRSGKRLEEIGTPGKRGLGFHGRTRKVGSGSIWDIF